MSGRRSRQPVAIWTLLGLLGGTLVVASATPVLAVDPMFSQKILPLNCVFETVNDGTGTLYYVTPAACGVLIQPTPTLGHQPAVLPTPQNEQAHARRSYPPATVPTTNTMGDTTQLPWQPITSTAPVTAGTTVSSGTNITKGTSKLKIAVLTTVSTSILMILILAIIIM